MILWRCPVPSKVFHAFDIPRATLAGRGRRRGEAFTSLCGQSQLMSVRKKFREPEVLNACEECKAQADTNRESLPARRSSQSEGVK